MAIGFTKDFSANGKTNVENAFITEYMPLVDGDAVKVYLYGLYLCANAKCDTTLNEIAKHLELSEEKVIDAFKLWQEFDLVSFVEEPFSVIYQSINTGYARAKKYKPEKYTDFCTSLQHLFPNKAIGISEYSEYFNIMEVYSISQDAMLMIVSHCIERKGDTISYRYISKVAKDFGARGINTTEKVEQELSKYVSRTHELEKILKAMRSTKQPEIENLKLLNKWTNELGFNMESILTAASTLKKGSFEKLDQFMMELYSLKCFSVEEIERHTDKKKELFDVSIKIAKALSLYFEVIDTVVDNFTSKWFKYGYQEDALLFIANYCFKQGKNTLSDMDTLIEFLFKRGVIDFDAVNGYFLRLEKDDEFIHTILDTLGLKRSVTNWDRDNLKVWREWNFSDEIILEAIVRSVGKSNPVAYANAILGGWKSKNIFNKTDIENLEKHDNVNKNNNVKVTIEMINAKYGERRYNANALAKNNLKKASKLAGFNDLHTRLKEIDIALAMSEFGGKKDNVAELETERSEVTRKLISLLKTVNLTLKDLEPKFKCEICKDTGIDGANKCRCYEEVLAECLQDAKTANNIK
ncbi:MAG: DnaD domain protein [Clostridia bacterium]|nr:DnaD domain protein [Clostridia bacterium]